MFNHTLKLILGLKALRPADSLPERLGDLFTRLQKADSKREASLTEDSIWAAWMEHDDPGAEAALDEATRALTAREFAAAERLLDGLIETHPEYAEAWNKRATLRYLQKRDVQSVADIQRVLRIEPRHFGAICGFAQICLRHGEKDTALFALSEALRLNPHLGSVREAYETLLEESSTPRQ